MTKCYAIICLIALILASRSHAAACPITSGPLTLPVISPRSSCISPCLIFFDATGTTDTSISGNTTVFQDVTLTWNFGDSGASGTSYWSYGSNPGGNSRNTATGGIAAHLYITAGSDTTYTVTVTATDGTNTATCTVSVTAYDPAGSNGFPGTATTCVSASGVPVAGSGGCPAGAAILNTSSFATALSGSRANKRALFKCGDTFTGDNVNVAGTKWSVGAYGGCESTQTNRPIFSDTGTNYHVNVSATASDGRIADINFTSSGTSGGAVSQNGGVAAGNPSQITLVNLNSTGNHAGYFWSQGFQWGLIDSANVNPSGASIVVFVNTNENNCVNGSTATNCGGNPVYYDVRYQAILGNNIQGPGIGSGGGVEAFRVSACRMCVIENNSINASNAVGSNIKFHNGNTNNSIATWTGQWTENTEISDNLIGPVGGAGIEIAPQNGGLDERIRNIVVERNVVTNYTTSTNTRQNYAGGQNITYRDNAFYMPVVGGNFPQTGVQFFQRGTGNLLTVQYNEAYNNVCYGPNSGIAQDCIEFTSVGGTAATANSVAKNNLLYVPSGSHTTVVNTGTGNVVSNNTANPNLNPGFTNGSGNFSVISDYKPTANFGNSTTILQQPTASGIAGNLFVHGATGPGSGNPPNGQFALVSEQSNPLTGSGLFQTNGWNAGALTGFTPTTPSTAQSGYAASGQTTTAQAEGNTVGVYLQSSDRPGDPTNSKMMITPRLSLAGTTVFPNSGITFSGSMQLQIPTAMGSDTYLNVNHQFAGPGGVFITFNVDIFRNGIASPSVSTSQDIPTNTYIINVPLGLAGSSTYVTAISGIHTGTPWIGFLPFAWTISQAQMVAALNLLHTAYPANVTSVDPSQYSLINLHINAEFHFNPGAATLGWSMRNWLETTIDAAGGTPVPVIYDAMGTAWPPTWDLGAIRHFVVPSPPGLRHRLLLSRYVDPMDIIAP